MIISITGGTGFIGSQLVSHHLGQGDIVRVLSRKVCCESCLPDSVEWYCGDLSISDELLSFVENADILYHCAGEITDESRMNALHVNGTRKLIAAATGCIGRWVQLSSVGVYGPVRDAIVTEDSPLHPIGVYEITKAQADALVLEASVRGAFESVVLRPSNIYGVEMRNRSLSQLFKMIERGWFFFIGRPGASANYVHVGDVINALVLCGKHPNAVGQTFNLSSWDTMERVVDSVASTLGKTIPTLRFRYKTIRLLAQVIGRLPGFPLTVSRVDALCNRSRYPINKIEKELGFSLQIPLRVGMAKLVSDWRGEG